MHPAIRCDQYGVAACNRLAERAEFLRASAARPQPLREFIANDDALPDISSAPLLASAITNGVGQQISSSGFAEVHVTGCWACELRCGIGTNQRYFNTVMRCTETGDAAALNHHKCFLSNIARPAGSRHQNKQRSVIFVPTFSILGNIANDVGFGTP